MSPSATSIGTSIQRSFTNMLMSTTIITATRTIRTGMEPSRMRTVIRIRRCGMSIRIFLTCIIGTITAADAKRRGKKTGALRRPLRDRFAPPVQCLMTALLSSVAAAGGTAASVFSPSSAIAVGWRSSECSSTCSIQRTG